MYNSELWTLVQTLENSIDLFQRKLQRRIINVKWPRTISNKNLYAWTWNEAMEYHHTNEKRLTWFGHQMCLPPKTPTRKPLRAFINPVKKPTGRQKTTWVRQVLKEIKLLSNLPLRCDISKNIEILKVEFYDRGDWGSAVSSMILTRLTSMQWRRRTFQVLLRRSSLPKKS